MYKYEQVSKYLPSLYLNITWLLKGMLINAAVIPNIP